MTKKETLPLPVTPINSDVLCRRGNTKNDNDGTKKFKGIIVENASSYNNLSEKRDKTRFTRDILNICKDDHFMRFLRLCDDGIWRELTDESARETIRQALKDKANGILAETDEINDDRSIATLNNANDILAETNEINDDPPFTALNLGDIINTDTIRDILDDMRSVDDAEFMASFYSGDNSLSELSDADADSYCDYSLCYSSDDDSSSELRGLALV